MFATASTSQAAFLFRRIDDCFAGVLPYAWARRLGHRVHAKLK